MLERETDQPAIAIANDDARKFVTTSFGDAFLKRHNAETFNLTTDWLFGGDSCEIKIVCRQYSDRGDRYHLITKYADGTTRRSYKLELQEKAYLRLTKSSCAHLEKERCEFDFVQDHVPFILKLDRYGVKGYCVLEVDAASRQEADRRSFRPDRFPYELREVSGDLRYYGIRLATNLPFGNDPTRFGQAGIETR